jgi:hypothetical protein
MYLFLVTQYPIIIFIAIKATDPVRPLLPIGLAGSGRPFENGFLRKY